MHHQHRKALPPVLGAGIGLLLTSGLLAASGTGPASGPAGATTAHTAAGRAVQGHVDGHLSPAQSDGHRLGHLRMVLDRQHPHGLRLPLPSPDPSSEWLVSGFRTVSPRWPASPCLSMIS
jgi:hypothetical protein